MVNIRLFDLLTGSYFKFLIYLYRIHLNPYCHLSVFSNQFFIYQLLLLSDKVDEALMELEDLCQSANSMLPFRYHKLTARPNWTLAFILAIVLTECS